MSLTTDKNHPDLQKIKENGQQEAYVILSEEERAKGFIRPVRRSYIHIGRPVERGTIQSLEEGLEGHSDFAKKEYTKENGYVAFLKYPEDRSPVTGKFIKQDELDSINSKRNYVGGCGTLTTMGMDLAETYARDPKFYGGTFCCGCRDHLPVGEFVWEGTNETVGS